MTSRAPAGFTPHRLRAPDAALFCGDSVSTFYEKVREGVFPKAAWKEGQISYWAVDELRAAMDERRLAAENPAKPEKPPAPRKLDQIRKQREALRQNL